MEGEKEIVRRAKDGDKEAFSIIYQKYGKQIFRFIYWRVSDKHLSEDILQDVFLKAWHGIKSYKERNLPIRAWLYKIARNAIIDHYRVKKPEFSLEESTIDLIYSGTDSLREVSVKLEIERARKAINLLPEIQKEVIILRFIEELTNKEVAGIIKKSETSVRIIQHRALKKLREMLKEN